MKSKPILILSGVLLILLGVMLFRNKKASEPMTSSEIPVVESVNKSEPQIIDPRGGLPSRMSPAQVKAWEKQDLMERKLGFQNFNLPKEGGDSVLNVELRVKGGCTPGDADAIDMDLKAAPSHQLLAKLEGMSRSTVSFNWNVPADLLTKKTAKNRFKLKATQEPLQLGFYLCTSKSGGSCQDKKVRDINEIFTEHLTKKPNAGQEERLIFYQYFLLDDQGLRTFEGYPRGKDHFDNLKKYAEERKFQGQNINEGIDKAQQALETMVSLPVSFEKDTLIVTLPQFDEAACADLERKVKAGANANQVGEKK